MTRNQDTLLSAMLSPGLYKRNQGKLVRQITGAVIAVVVLFGAWTLHAKVLVDMAPEMRNSIATVVGAIGLWFAYRIVNYPLFADFLIDVEAELTKVSWPVKDELFRATVVVLTTMILLSTLLFVYDILWQNLLRMIGVLQF